MNVLIIGGTGLLGLESAKELLKRGHNVKTITLPEIPKELIIPKEMEVIFGDYETMSDNELRHHLRNQEGLIFAAGVDERVHHSGDPYEYYKNKNITPLKKLLRLAKEMKVKSAVICGSYFTYLDRLWENLYLYETHPYIKSRVDQSNEAFIFADRNFAVTVLELPYIFGVQEGRKPVWVFLIEQIKRMKCITFYPKGGTAMITVHQAGQAIASSLETAKGSKMFPVGYYNMTWKKMLRIIHKALGTPKKPIISISKAIYKLAMIKYKRKLKKNNINTGLNLSKLPDIMTRRAYIDSKYVKDFLKVKEDNIEKAITDSVKLSLEYINEEENFVEMK